MAGVRPAGSTESWQSWMDSLAKENQTDEDKAKDDEASAAATQAAAPSGHVTPIEMSPEAFYAVEEEAMRAEIGSVDDVEEMGEAPDDSASSPITGSFDPNDSPLRMSVDDHTPWANPPAAEAQAASESRLPGGPNFESAPGFNWDSPASELAPAAHVEPAPPMPAASFEHAESSPYAESAATPAPPALAPHEAFDTLEISAAKPAAAHREAPTARVSAAPAQPMPASTALPLRLRERIEAAERAEASQGNRTGWLIGVAVLAVVAIGVTFAVRSRNGASPAATTPAGTTATSREATPGSTTNPVNETPTASSPKPSTPPSAPPAAVATGNNASTVASKPSAPAVTRPANPPAVKPAASTTPASEVKPSAPKTPAPAAAVAASKPTPVAAAPKPAAKTSFGISVASFLAEERALAESARLSSVTGLPARLMATKDGDYRVVLGSFSDRAAAEKAAGELIGGGKVDEARVVSLGSK